MVTFNFNKYIKNNPLLKENKSSYFFIVYNLVTRNNPDYDLIVSKWKEKSTKIKIEEDLKNIGCYNIEFSFLGKNESSDKNVINLGIEFLIPDAIFKNKEKDIDNYFSQLAKTLSKDMYSQQTRKNYYIS